MCLYKGSGILLQKAVFYILTETVNGKPVREVINGLAGTDHAEAKISDPAVLNAYFNGFGMGGKVTTLHIWN